jgi:hypothetical protein
MAPDRWESAGLGKRSSAARGRTLPIRIPTSLPSRSFPLGHTSVTPLMTWSRDRPRRACGVRKPDPSQRPQGRNPACPARKGACTANVPPADCRRGPRAQRAPRDGSRRETSIACLGVAAYFGGRGVLETVAAGIRAADRRARRWVRKYEQRRRATLREIASDFGGWRWLEVSDAYVCDSILWPADICSDDGRSRRKAAVGRHRPVRRAGRVSVDGHAAGRQVVWEPQAVWVL